MKYIYQVHIYQINVKQFYFRDIKYHSYRQNEVSQNMEYYVGGQNPVYPFREFGLIHSNREEHCNYCERNFNALINPLLIEIMEKKTKRAQYSKIRKTYCCKYALHFQQTNAPNWKEIFVVLLDEVLQLP